MWLCGVCLCDVIFVGFVFRYDLCGLRCFPSCLISIFDYVLCVLYSVLSVIAMIRLSVHLIGVSFFL